MVSQFVYFIVRMCFVKEIFEFIVLGVDDVIFEEFEILIEIFFCMFYYFFILEDDIGYFVEIICFNNYGFFQNKKSIFWIFCFGKYLEFDIICLKVWMDNWWIVGKMLSEFDVRN